MVPLEVVINDNDNQENCMSCFYQIMNAREDIRFLVEHTCVVFLSLFILERDRSEDTR